MPRINLTVSKRMHEELRRESEETNVPIAAIIREAIAERAQRRGKEIKDTVTWGGSRVTLDPEDESPKGQVVAVA